MIIPTIMFQHYLLLVILLHITNASIPSLREPEDVKVELSISSNNLHSVDAANRQDGHVLVSLTPYNNGNTICAIWHKRHTLGYVYFVDLTESQLRDTIVQHDNTHDPTFL